MMLLSRSLSVTRRPGECRRGAIKREALGSEFLVRGVHTLDLKLSARTALLTACPGRAGLRYALRH